jgi:hypothetical protein
VEAVSHAPAKLASMFLFLMFYNILKLTLIENVAEGNNTLETSHKVPALEVSGNSFFG